MISLFTQSTKDKKRMKPEIIIYVPCSYTVNLKLASLLPNVLIFNTSHRCPPAPPPAPPPTTYSPPNSPHQAQSSRH